MDALVERALGELTTSAARRPRLACARRIEPAARTAARSSVGARRRRRVRIEEHRGLVARRVLELLHHQLRRAWRSWASGRGAATRPAGSRARCGGRTRTVAAGAGAGPRACAPPPRRAGRRRRAAGRRGWRPSAAQLDSHPLEPERILDHDLRLLDRVAAAGHPPQHVAARRRPCRRASGVSRSPSRAICSASVPEGSDAGLVQLERDGDVVAREPLARPRSVAGHRAPQPKRTQSAADDAARIRPSATG